MLAGLGQPIQDKFTASGTNKMVTLATQRKFREALRCAARWHAQQFRKGTKVPYIAHLLGVASLVLEDGGNTNQAIAALLHDAVEDQGGRRRYAEIRRRFGPRVAAIVKGCTDDGYQLPKPSWRLRKKRYLQHLEHASLSVLRVSLADKLHNARAILADHRRVGNRVWRRFNAPPRDELRYYRELAHCFERRLPGAMAAELSRCVRAMTALGSH